MTGWAALARLREPPTTAKTTLCAAFDWTESDQLKAVPAKDSNQGSSWGYPVAGWSWRWRCGPVASPVEPTRPTLWPAASWAPATTAGSISARWQYVQESPSVVVRVNPLPQSPPPEVSQTRSTTASDSA